MIRVEEAMITLENAQAKLIQDPHNPSLQIEVKIARGNYSRLLAFEESFLKKNPR